jgi:hypothetical protein
MTRAGRATRPMQRRVANTAAPDQNARRRSAQSRSNSVAAERETENRKGQWPPPTAWVHGAAKHQGRRRRAARRRRAEAGQPQGVAAAANAQRGERALKGKRTSREAPDRSWLLREATPLAAYSPRSRALDRTGGAGAVRSARKGGREPVRRSAVLTSDDRRPLTRPRRAGAATGRPAGGPSQCGRRVFRPVLHAGWI